MVISSGVVTPARTFSHPSSRKSRRPLFLAVATISGDGARSITLWAISSVITINS